MYEVINRYKEGLFNKVVMRKTGVVEPFTVVYLTFPNIKVPHAVSTRLGGVSGGNYRGLNIGYTTEDDLDLVEENRARLAWACGIPLRPILNMIHGTEIILVDDTPVDPQTVGDGCITDTPNAPMMITTADCVPVIFYDPKKRAVGLAHAGWRGTLARICQKTVEAMSKNFSSDPGDLQVGIGPSIGPCCFEVGEDVADLFKAEFAGRDLVQELPSSEVKGSSVPKFKVDLWGVNIAVLREAGVPLENIFSSRICSRCREDLCYSYRRDRGTTGRMASLVVLPPV